VAKTLRRTLLALPGRLTRSARRWIMHLPAGWPWAAWFELAWRGCAASPTPPDTTTGPRKLPRPDRASASLPKHAWPAARVLPIDPNRPRAVSIMPPAHTTTAANRAPRPHQPTKNSGIGGSRLRHHAGAHWASRGHGFQLTSANYLTRGQVPAPEDQLPVV
jgi:hypothetical protein